MVGMWARGWLAADRDRRGRCETAGRAWRNNTKQQRPGKTSYDTKRHGPSKTSYNAQQHGPSEPGSVPVAPTAFPAPPSLGGGAGKTRMLKPQPLCPERKEERSRCSPLGVQGEPLVVSRGDRESRGPKGGKSKSPPWPFGPSGARFLFRATQQTRPPCRHRWQGAPHRPPGGYPASGSPQPATPIIRPAAKKSQRTIRGALTPLISPLTPRDTTPPC